jgi:hypothetical protein
MFTGMLWYDNDPTTALAAKVQRAAEYYRRKYGAAPDTCVVNPAMLGAPTQPSPIFCENGGGQGRGWDVTVRASRTILPGHLWIGVEEKLPTAAD